MCRIYFYDNKILWVFRLMKILALPFGFWYFG
jgi:hypothetical protein